MQGCDWLSRPEVVGDRVGCRGLGRGMHGQPQGGRRRVLSLMLRYILGWSFASEP